MDKSTQHPVDPRRDPDFQDTFGASAAPVLVLDPVHDRIVNANLAAAGLLGYSCQELLQTPVSAIHPRDMNQLLELSREVVSNGRPRTGNITCVTRDGEPVPAEVSASFVDGMDGIRIVALVRRRDGALEARHRTSRERERDGGHTRHGRRRAERELETTLTALERPRASALHSDEPLDATPHGGGRYGPLVGDSEALHGLMNAIERAAPTDARVLITGESGTGKELVARAIHARSARRHGPLVRVNCAAVPGELFESEFFGHVRGAFTGATANRVGRFEQADGGTLFLDEVAEIPLALQGKLLRILQDGMVERVGASDGREVDVRVIAATNRDITAAVEHGGFRADLFYRLNVFPIHVTPLRERGADIRLLAEHFVAQARVRLQRPELHLVSADLARLEAFDWPGNVRELQNVVERGIILADADGRLPIELPLSRARRGPCAAAHADLPPCGYLTERQRRERDRRSILAALEAAGGKVAGDEGAAALLGIRPTTLNSRIKALGIEHPPSARGRGKPGHRG